MTFEFLAPKAILRKARNYARKLWVRVVLMGLLAFVSLGFAHLIEGLLPEEISHSVNGAAADRLLNIIANAMLAVTTFSITVMVTVYRSSSTQWTPRVHRLIMEDRTTQNTLAVFIGAYVYSLVGIVLREVHVYNDDHALVLFVMTVAVIAVIVLYLIRWVLHLQSFGSLIDTTRQIEEVARRELRQRLDDPCLGARPLLGDIPATAEPIRAQDSGYVQEIYTDALNSIAEAHGVTLYLARDVGSFVLLDQPLVMVVHSGNVSGAEAAPDDLEAAVRRNVIIGDVRTYDQDPRFGLIVMGEVASKALSPGVNDPGTAIEVITRMGRILTDYRDENSGRYKVRLDRLYLRPLSAADLIADAFGALARDGAAVVEVQQRLQKIYAALLSHPDAEMRRAVKQAAETELRRAMAAMPFGHDRDRMFAASHLDIARAIREEIEKLEETPTP